MQPAAFTSCRFFVLELVTGLSQVMCKKMYIDVVIIYTNPKDN